MKRIWKKLLAFVLVATMLLQYVPEMKATASEGEATAVPTIGNATNLATLSSKQLTAFNPETAHIQYYDSNAIKVQGSTWYYSGTFNYSWFKNCTGVHFVFASCTYNNATVPLAVTARPIGSENSSTETQCMIGTNLTQNYVGPTTGTYTKEFINEINKNYVFTIKVSDNKLWFWIDDYLVFNGHDLTTLTGVTNITPTQFGTYSNGAKGTLSNMQIWDEVQVRPERTNEVNLAQSDKTKPTSFVSGTTSLDLGTVEVKGDTWYYSGTFQYSTLTDSGGLHFNFGKCTYYDDDAPTTEKTGTLQVTARPLTTLNEDGITRTTTGTFLLLGVTGGTGNGYAIGGTNFSYSQGQLYTTGQEYAFCVKVRENRYLSFWIDNTRFYNEFDLTSLEDDVVSITPENFGFRGDATTGTISNIQIWDEEQINLAYGLTDLPTTFGNPWYQSIDSLGTLAVTGDTWYYSAKYQYSAPPENTNAFCLRVIVGSGTKPDGTVVDVKVGIRGTYNPTTKQYSTTGQYMIWIGDSDADIVSVNWSGKALNWTEKCTFTAKVSDKKLSFYIDNVVAFDNFDLSDDVEKTDYKLTQIVPKFGLRRDNCTGTISDFQIWGDLAPGTVYEKFDDISIYRGENATEPYPTKEHYVFAGWFEQENDTYPISTTTTTGSAYAKFVDEDVMSVKCQLPATEPEGDKTKLRLVTSIDNDEYQNIGFRMDFGEGESAGYRQYTATDVWEYITGTDGTNTFTYYPKCFATSANWMMGIAVNGVPKSILEDGLTITAIWTTLDGTVVRGSSKYLQIDQTVE